MMEKNTEILDEFVLKNEFPEYCRLCAKERYDCHFDVFGKNENIFVQKIKNLFNFKVHPNDEWHKICIECHDKLEICYEFYEEVQKAQKILTKVRVLKTQNVNVSVLTESLIESPVVKIEKNIPTIQIQNKSDTNIKDRRKSKETRIMVSDDKMNEFYKYVCSSCNTNFESYSMYEIHMRNDHQEENPSVSCCDMAIPCIRIKLLEHYLLHTNPKILQCRHCGQQCFGKRALVRHETTHSRNFPCSQCDKSFYNKQALEGHFTSFHIPVSQRKFYECHFCSVKRTTKFSVLRHLIQYHKMQVNHVINQTQEFLCPDCGKVFTHKTTFQSHIKNSHDNRMETCPECGKYVKTKQLRSHIRNMHDNVAKNCPICHKICKNNARMKAHMKNTHDEASDKCDLCEKVFKGKGKLKDHRKLHFIDKPFKCDVCDVLNNDYANILKHRKQVHPNATPIPHGMGRHVLEIGFNKRKK